MEDHLPTAVTDWGEISTDKVLVVYVVVVYFMFLIGTCILAVVLTIIVQHLYLRSESTPFVAMSTSVSTKLRQLWLYIQGAAKKYLPKHFFGIFSAMA